MLPVDQLSNAIDLYSLGNKILARQILVHIVISEPRNEAAWLWLAACVDRLDQKKDCFRQVLAINPSNVKAKELLERYERLPTFLPQLLLDTQDIHNTKSISIYVAGVRYEENPNAVRQLHLLEPVNITREHQNPFDVNAIRVETMNGKKFGFIPKKLASILAGHMDKSGLSLNGIVTDLTSDLLGENLRVQIALFIPISNIEIFQATEELVSDATQRLYYFDNKSPTVTYLMLECSETTCDLIKSSFVKQGIDFTRTTMTYRPATDGRYYRWCMRLDNLSDTKRLIVEEILTSQYHLTRSVEGLIAELQKQSSDTEFYRQVAEISDNNELELKRENERLAAEAREKDDRVRQAQSEKETILQNWWKPEPASETSSELFFQVINDHTVSALIPYQILSVIADLFPDRVQVLEKAFKSTEEIKRSKHKKKLFERLWQLVNNYRDALARGEADESARQIFGDDYAPKESETTDGNRDFRKLRTFNEIYMPRHLKIGDIRIHFEWFPQEQKIFIGHCGKHLPTSDNPR